MSQFLSNIIKRGQFGELLTNSFTQRTIKVFVIHCLGILFTLLSNFWFAKLLNVEGYGQYSFIITIVNLLSSFACLGFSSIMVRDISMYASQNKFGEIKGLIRFSFITCLITAFVFFIIFSIVSYFNLLPQKYDLFTLINIGISIISTSLILLRQYTLQGFKHSTESQIVNGLVRYVIVIILLLVTLLILSVSISTSYVILINAISLVFCLIIIEILLRKKMSLEVSSAKPVFHTNIWMKGALLLLTYKLMITYLSGSEIILLGYLRTDDEVGVYSLSRKISGFVSFGLLASNVVLAPKLASFQAEGDIESLQTLIKKSTRAIFIFSFFVMASLALVALPVFDYLGEDYNQSYLPLLIMMGGELLNVAFGPVATLLINSKQENMANKIMILTIMFNLLGNIILIPMYGFIGAAIITALSTIMWNGLMALAVKNKMGIKSWIW